MLVPLFKIAAFTEVIIITDTTDVPLSTNWILLAAVALDSIVDAVSRFHLVRVTERYHGLTTRLLWLPVS